MPEIIFESNKGIIFEKTVYKNGRCKLTVKNKGDGLTHATYRYKDVPGLVSPYVNWENLNCCNGWTYDESYLYTAVQRGKKLYAGITFSMYDEDYAEELKTCCLPTERDVIATIERLKIGLPGDCILGEERPDSSGYRSRSRHIFICVTGAISDYISINDVYLAYGRLGVTIETNAKEEIKRICDLSVPSFAAENPPFEYWNPYGGFRLIVTGLLLGYPIETTAALLERDGFNPVYK